MPQDLTLDITRIRDEAKPERDGSVSDYKRIEFYLGRLGPFVERMTTADYQAGELDRRVRALRATIQSHDAL